MAQRVQKRSSVAAAAIAEGGGLGKWKKGSEDEVEEGGDNGWSP